MSHNIDCPSETLINRFHDGHLSDDDAEFIGTHLETCQNCKELNPLVPFAKSAFSNEPRSVFFGERGCQQAVEKVRRFLFEPVRREGISHLSLPKQIGNYQLLEVIGAGGMGVVYHARHTRLHRSVALKVLDPRLISSNQVLLRFQQEMKAIGSLDHPNIVRALDADKQDEIDFLVMEYVPGLNLSDLIRAVRIISIPDACELVRQTAMGLSHAHLRGLIHRDVKPSNLMVTETADGNGLVKILDLGLARLEAQEGATSLTNVGQVMGTLEYMAPEQSEESRHITEQVDIYSLGCTLYYLLVGQPPFPAQKFGSPIQLMRAIATETPQLISSFRQVPKELDLLVDSMLSRGPESRPDSCAIVAQQLERFAEESDLSGLLKQVRQVPPVLEGAKTTLEFEGAPETLVNADVSTDAGTGHRKQRADRESKSSFFWKVLVCSALVLISAAVVLLLPTKHGIVRIDILDPSIEVMIDGTDKFLVTEGEASFEVIPGKHALHIKTAAFNFETQKFAVERNNTTALKVSIIAGNTLRVLNGNKILDEYQIPASNRPETRSNKSTEKRASLTPEMPVEESGTISELNRNLARQLLQGGQRILHLEVGGESYSLRGNNLPQGNPFRVTYIQTRPHSPISEEEFELMLNSRLDSLEVIRFTDQNPPADWLERLHEVYPDLKELYGFHALPEYFEPLDRFKKLTLHVLYGISSEEAARWTRMLCSKPDLNFIHYHKCSVNQNVFDVLVQSKNMETLAFMSESFGDEGFLALSKIRSLKSIRLESFRGSFSRAGLMQLAAHPNLNEIVVKNTQTIPVNDLKSLLKTLPGCELVVEKNGVQNIYHCEDVIDK